MSRMNCWEFFECGREPDGKKVREHGICPASVKAELDGMNDGENGGRCCWAIAGTFCGGEAQGTYAQKLGNCLKCDFHAFVRGQQHNNYASTKKILTVINGKIKEECTTNSLDNDNQLKDVI
jgi:hypothetical protein